MPTLFASIVAWLARKAGTLLVILAILVAAAWVSAEWARLAQVQAEIRRAEAIRDGLRADLARMDAPPATGPNGARRPQRHAERSMESCAGSTRSWPARVHAGSRRHREVRRSGATCGRRAARGGPGQDEAQ